MLDSIDKSKLSESDRHRYDLLSIKSRDKAYVRHTSDSLVMEVIDYYSKHQNSGIYPEALYYGGRVYSDIGDLPTALYYFQIAIDNTPKDEKYLKFKSVLLSQVGRLLEELRLYNQAIPYIQEAINISRQLNDSVGIFYDELQLISHYINIDSIGSARNCINEALRFSNPLPNEDKALLEIKKALLLLHEGKTASALSAIRPHIYSTRKLSKNYALRAAADTYKEAGIYDTAYMYAKELSMSKVFNNRILGFNILFSPELLTYIPQDSIVFLVREYGSYMNEYRNRYDSQEALIQNAKYNYTLHDRRRERAEQERTTLVAITIILGLLLIVVIIYFKYQNLKAKMGLSIAIQLVREIELYAQGKTNKHCIALPESSPNKTEVTSLKPLLGIPSRKQDLKKELFEKLKNVVNTDQQMPVSDEFLQSTDIVRRLNRMVNKGEGIRDADKKTWIEIEQRVHDSSPEFRSRLYILTMDKLTDKEYQVALLIRCRIAPKDIATLLFKSKSTITDRRTSLTKKIFGSSADNTALDKLILLL